jgi:hypothetical protein
MSSDESSSMSRSSVSSSSVLLRVGVIHDLDLDLTLALRFQANNKSFVKPLDE